eukprot:gene26452-17551_t
MEVVMKLQREQSLPAPPVRDSLGGDLLTGTPPEVDANAAAEPGLASLAADQVGRSSAADQAERFSATDQAGRSSATDQAGKSSATDQTGVGSATRQKEDSSATMKIDDSATKQVDSSSSVDHVAGASSATELVARASSATGHVAGASSVTEHVAGASSATEHVAGASSATEHVAGASSATEHVAGVSSAAEQIVASLATELQELRRALARPPQPPPYPHPPGQHNQPSLPLNTQVSHPYQSEVVGVDVSRRVKVALTRGRKKKTLRLSVKASPLDQSAWGETNSGLQSLGHFTSDGHWALIRMIKPEHERDYGATPQGTRPVGAYLQVGALPLLSPLLANIQQGPTGGVPSPFGHATPQAMVNDELQGLQASLRRSRSGTSLGGVQCQLLDPGPAQGAAPIPSQQPKPVPTSPFLAGAFAALAAELEGPATRSSSLSGPFQEAVVPEDLTAQLPQPTVYRFPPPHSNFVIQEAYSLPPSGKSAIPRHLDGVLTYDSQHSIGTVSIRHYNDLEEEDDVEFGTLLVGGQLRDAVAVAKAALAEEPGTSTDQSQPSSHNNSLLSMSAYYANNSICRGSNSAVLHNSTPSSSDNSNDMGPTSSCLRTSQRPPANTSGQPATNQQSTAAHSSLHTHGHKQNQRGGSSQASGSNSLNSSLLKSLNIGGTDIVVAPSVEPTHMAKPNSGAALYFEPRHTAKPTSDAAPSVKPTHAAKPSNLPQVTSAALNWIRANNKSRAPDQVQADAEPMQEHTPSSIPSATPMGSVPVTDTSTAMGSVPLTDTTTVQGSLMGEDGSTSSSSSSSASSSPSAARGKVEKRAEGGQRPAEGGGVVGGGGDEEFGSDEQKGVRLQSGGATSQGLSSEQQRPSHPSTQEEGRGYATCADPEPTSADSKPTNADPKPITMDKEQIGADQMPTTVDQKKKKDSGPHSRAAVLAAVLAASEASVMPTDIAPAQPAPVAAAVVSVSATAQPPVSAAAAAAAAAMNRAAMVSEPATPQLRISAGAAAAAAALNRAKWQGIQMDMGGGKAIVTRPATTSPPTAQPTTYGSTTPAADVIGGLGDSASSSASSSAGDSSGANSDSEFEAVEFTGSTPPPATSSKHVPPVSTTSPASTLGPESTTGRPDEADGGSSTSTGQPNLADRAGSPGTSHVHQAEGGSSTSTARLAESRKLMSMNSFNINPMESVNHSMVSVNAMNPLESSGRSFEANPPFPFEQSDNSFGTNPLTSGAPSFDVAPMREALQSDSSFGTNPLTSGAPSYDGQDVAPMRAALQSTHGMAGQRVGARFEDSLRGRLEKGGKEEDRDIVDEFEEEEEEEDIKSDISALGFASEYARRQMDETAAAAADLVRSSSHRYSPPRLPLQVQRNQGAASTSSRSQDDGSDGDEIMMLSDYGDSGSSSSASTSAGGLGPRGPEQEGGRRQEGEEGDSPPASETMVMRFGSVDASQQGSLVSEPGRPRLVGVVDVSQVSDVDAEAPTPRLVGAAPTKPNQAPTKRSESPAPTGFEDLQSEASGMSSFEADASDLFDSMFAEDLVEGAAAKCRSGGSGGGGSEVRRQTQEHGQGPDTWGSRLRTASGAVLGPRLGFVAAAPITPPSAPQPTLVKEESTAESSDIEDTLIMDFMMEEEVASRASSVASFGSHSSMDLPPGAPPPRLSPSAPQKSRFSKADGLVDLDSLDFSL